MLLVWRRLPLIIELKSRILILKAIDSRQKSKRFSSQRIWFWKLLILDKNQKGFLLSPVYKHLKGIFPYTRNEKGTQLKKNTQHTRPHAWHYFSVHFVALSVENLLKWSACSYCLHANYYFSLGLHSTVRHIIILKLASKDGQNFQLKTQGIF